MATSYYVAVPASAVFAIDRFNYARVTCRVTPDGIRDCPPRMVRADGPRRGDIFYIWVGTMGSAIATHDGLPDGVTYIQHLDSEPRPASPCEVTP